MGVPCLDSYYYMCVESLFFWCIIKEDIEVP